MKAAATTLLLAIMLVGCDGTTSDQSADADAKAAAAPATPQHLWQYREGREYGYAGSISEDARRAGAAAAEVQMYRYLGQKDGVYTVEMVDPSGANATASCTKPCQVVIATSEGVTKRLTFSPDSIVGGALTDAMNGQLEPYQPTK